jgi:hypothetical protein
MKLSSGVPYLCKNRYKTSKNLDFQSLIEINRLNVAKVGKPNGYCLQQ